MKNKHLTDNYRKYTKKPTTNNSINHYFNSRLSFFTIKAYNISSNTPLYTPKISQKQHLILFRRRDKSFISSIIKKHTYFFNFSNLFVNKIRIIIKR